MAEVADSDVEPDFATRRPGATLLFSLFGVAVVGALAYTPAETPTPLPFELEEQSRSMLRPWPLEAEALPRVDPEALLEARLAAFARSVEKRRRRPDAKAAEFDDGALASALTDVVDAIADRASASIHIRDLGTGRVLFDYEGDSLLNPASNQKLVTSAAALDLLGPDFEFVTDVFLSGDALVLVGEGDPSFLHEHLWTLADVVAAHVSLGSITRIVVDDSAFSSRRFGPGFSDEGPGVSYQAPSGALSLDFNTVVVTVHRAGRGRPLVVIDPPSTHVVVDNRASPGAGILRIATREEMRKDGDHRTVVELTGKLSSARASARRRVTDPGLFTGGAFAARLAEVTETEPLPVARGVAPEDAELVARHRSETLAEIVADELAYSNNFAAEQLIRVLGHAMTGDSGDWENGLEVVRRYWDALGNDPDALLLENGSGFSDSGRVSTSALVDLIEVARDDGLLGALPVAGEAGTLRGRLRHSGKRVRAKTGTLAGVSGLSGVITDEAGTAQVAFSILINADPGSGLMAAGRREIEDAVVTTVLEHLDAWEARKISEELEPS